MTPRRTSRDFSKRYSAPSRRGGGFTLIELLLVLMILAVTAAISLSNYTAAGRREEFREGVDRFTTLLRALRNQAQLDGRMLQLRFRPELTVRGASFYVVEEAPGGSGSGVFVELDDGAWLKYFRTGKDISPLVLSCELVGEDALIARAMGLDDTGQDYPLEPISFRPDGSCDSAELILASPYPKVTAGVKVTVDGLLGEVATARLSAEAMEQYR